MNGWFWITAMVVGAGVPLAVAGAFAAAGYCIDYYSAAGTRQRRRSAGQCEQCAYSMVGNRSGICPECGNAAPPLATDPVVPPEFRSLHFRRWAWVGAIALGMVLA